MNRSYDRILDQATRFSSYGFCPFQRRDKRSADQLKERIRDITGTLDGLNDTFFCFDNNGLFVSYDLPSFDEWFAGS